MRWDAEKYDAVKAPRVDAGRELIAGAKVQDIDTILDIGCGTGKLTLELALLAHNAEVIGIDPSEEMMNKAKETCAQVQNISLLPLTAQVINFGDKFDLVFSNSALQWVKEHDKVLESVYRALKKGGRIAFQFPAKNFCKEFTKAVTYAIEVVGLEDRYSEWKSPWTFFTESEFSGKLKQAGFINIDVTCKDYTLGFESVNDTLDWWASAGLRPYLDPLSERQREYFQYAFAMSFENNRTENGIKLNFRRLFAFAGKG
ncbi:MAG TPA: methyltransferase domain-containing protein [Nitrospirae bacterium]|nr:methyltransferase domain-containing protein [Nitrospirota bacterium]